MTGYVKIEPVQNPNATADLTLQAMEEKAKALQGQVEVLTNEVERLRLRIKELEGQASNNSKNSSKPPSSDGLKKTASLRVASAKKPGGQAGHVGKTLAQTDTPDLIIRHALPERCDACQARLSNSNAQVHRRGQVFDIPAVRFEVVEHQALRLRCACGKLHESEFAPAVCEVAQYGPNVRALAVHLTQGQLLPFARGRTHQGPVRAGHLAGHAGAVDSRGGAGARAHGAGHRAKRVGRRGGACR